MREVIATDADFATYFVTEVASTFACCVRLELASVKTTEV
jgi:hypothetical protein